MTTWNIDSCCCFHSTRTHKHLWVLDSVPSPADEFLPVPTGQLNGFASVPVVFVHGAPGCWHFPELCSCQPDEMLYFLFIPQPVTVASRSRAHIGWAAGRPFHPELQSPLIKVPLKTPSCVTCFLQETSLVSRAGLGHSPGCSHSIVGLLQANAT